MKFVAISCILSLTACLPTGGDAHKLVNLAKEVQETVKGPSSHALQATKRIKISENHHIKISPKYEAVDAIMSEFGKSSKDDYFTIWHISDPVNGFGADKLSKLFDELQELKMKLKIIQANKRAAEFNKDNNKMLTRLSEEEKIVLENFALKYNQMTVLKESIQNLGELSRLLLTEMSEKKRTLSEAGLNLIRKYLQEIAQQ